MVAVAALCDHTMLHLGANPSHLSAITMLFCPGWKGLSARSAQWQLHTPVLFVREQLIQTAVVTLVLIFSFPL